ncbi:hypothetical protein Scep_024913 [Stephania cephalantha]|uniref:PGG domain-containing protein n=1 Tax=Stephania cephalantha TaxID=152367 RepID=A0AAP0F4Q1_9MAGN
MSVLVLIAMEGRVEIMKELFRWRPGALDKVLFDGGETVLHLCVKHSRLEALELSLQWLEDRQVSINSKDGHGNTILHLAVAKKHIQIIKLLLLSNSSSAHGVEVNALNKNGLTALDILLQSTVRDPKDLEIAEVLRGGAGGLRAAAEIISTGSTNNNSSSKANAAHVITIRSDKPIATLPTKQFKTYLHANSIGVVGSLIVTILVMSGLPLNGRVFIWILMFIMCASIAAMGISYILAVSSFTPLVYSDEFLYIEYSWKAMVVFVLMHTTRLLSWMVDKTRRRRRRRIFLWLWCPIAMVALGYLTVFDHSTEFCNHHNIASGGGYDYCIP